MWFRRNPTGDVAARTELVRTTSERMMIIADGRSTYAGKEVSTTM